MVWFFFLFAFAKSKFSQPSTTINFGFFRIFPLSTDWLLGLISIVIFVFSSICGLSLFHHHLNCFIVQWSFHAIFFCLIGVCVGVAVILKLLVCQFDRVWLFFFSMFYLVSGHIDTLSQRVQIFNDPFFFSLVVFFAAFCFQLYMHRYSQNDNRTVFFLGCSNTQWLIFESQSEKCTEIDQSISFVVVVFHSPNHTIYSICSTQSFFFVQIVIVFPFHKQLYNLVVQICFTHKTLSVNWKRYV